MSWLGWKMMMPALPPTRAPTVWTSTRRAGNMVWMNRAALGPQRLISQPVMKRLAVPSTHTVRREPGRPATGDGHTAERGGHCENRDLLRGGAVDLGADARIAGAVIRSMV